MYQFENRIGSLQLLDKNKDFITNFEIMYHFRNPKEQKEH